MNQSEKKYMLKRLEEIFNEKYSKVNNNREHAYDSEVLHYMAENNLLKLRPMKEIKHRISKGYSDYHAFIDDSDFSQMRRRCSEKMKEENKKNAQKRTLLKEAYQNAKDSVMLGEYGIAELQKFIDLVI